MNEEMAIFKSYLRAQLRQLEALKEAVAAQDYEKVNRMLDELMDDMQKNIED